MSETLQARLGHVGANASPNKAWKKAKKPHNLGSDYQQHASWPPRRDSSSSSYEPEEGYQPSNHVAPSLIDRLGLKACSTPPTQPRSLLERIELPGSEAADPVAHTSEANFTPLDSVNINREMDGGIAVESIRPSPGKGDELTEVHAQNPTQTELSWNGTNDRPDTHYASAVYSDRVNGRMSEAPAANSGPPESHHNYPATAQKAHETLAPVSTSDRVPSNIEKPPPLPSQARIMGSVLRSAVLENAKLRYGAFDADKVQSKIESKIESIVTENVAEAFGAQIRKVKKELDASRAKDQLSNGFGNNSASGDDTWLKRRDSHSLLASTSVLPTPPPSEPLPTENSDKPLPKAPKAMLKAHLPPAPLPPSFKGKEKAVEPTEGHAGARRPSLRASPMHNASEDGRSPPRRVSPSSPSRSSFALDNRRATGDELPTYRYRSPPRSPPRTNLSPFGPPRNYSHSPTRTARRHSPPRSNSRSRSGWGGSPPPRTRSFNSRRPSTPRSPPPSASYSNGFGSRSSRKSRSRSTARNLSRGRTFSGGEFNSRQSHEKRPSVRSPSPFRGRRDGSALDRRSQSPLPRKRKLTHSSPPRSRSPLNHRRRSPPSLELTPRGRGRVPGWHYSARDAPYSTPPSAGSSGRGYEDSPTTPFGPPPPAAHTRDASLPPPPPPPNPCLDVPGLWFVKVGADSPRILEGKFVVEPDFAATWGLQPISTSTTPTLSVVLLCLSTEAVSTLYNSLVNPTPESLATALASLETAWPQDGTLFLDMNEGRGGKTWLPNEFNPNTPLDITKFIQPGLNVVRFIQLTGMAQRTFILYASLCKPPDDVVSHMFENVSAAATKIQIENPLFSFDPASATMAPS
ncbi:hypothetical protein K438DRAFT_466222 [Mycena galopus ATCC 62051]|nr:hypothetical protein K438DRAFT_466222 [Mycena galopus ATCC 62051]